MSQMKLLSKYIEQKIALMNENNKFNTFIFFHSGGV